MQGSTGWYNDSDQLFDEKTRKKFIISRLFSSGATCGLGRITSDE